MLEVYQAYGDYGTMMELTEALIVHAIAATGQQPKLEWGDRVIDFTPPFARHTYDELFAQAYRHRARTIPWLSRSWPARSASILRASIPM